VIRIKMEVIIGLRNVAIERCSRGGQDLGED
jgi:hypothetical protein